MLMYIFDLVIFIIMDYFVNDVKIIDFVILDYLVVYLILCLEKFRFVKKVVFFWKLCGIDMIFFWSDIEGFVLF